MAWMEMIKTSRENIDPSLIDEMDKDLQRLNLVTERFSKIGSEPILKEANISEVVITALDYMEKRSSKKVTFNIHNNAAAAICMINIPLFEWVIENLTKNAIDAMNGEGTITCSLNEAGRHVNIDFTDTGKGLKTNQYKTIFNPGFTTKKRGWGMGLSLVKRIVESYHEGKIFVKHSEVNKGTTIRIELRKI
jgi:signal transduction histidine kinase